MSLFIPEASKIGDANVPAVCPRCCSEFSLDQLSPEEKQALIDLTNYHRHSIEYAFFRTIGRIVEQFPGTQHSLLVGKLPPNRTGYTDDELVQRELEKHKGLIDFLSHCRFHYDKRWPFVRQHETTELPSIPSCKLRCTKCDGHYLILPDKYFLAIGI